MGADLDAFTGDAQGNLAWLLRAEWTGSDERGRPATTAEGAEVYVPHGVPIFPLAGKDPVTAHGFKDAALSTAPWTQRAGLNIGWPLPVGLWALDVDPRHEGDKALGKLEQEHGPLPMTLRATTGSGGAHWIFREPAGRRIRQCAQFAPGLDTRAGGRGYLVVAPSIHPSTRRAYRWHTVVAPVEAPEWLVELVVEKPVREVPIYTPRADVDPRTLTDRQRYARGALNNLVQRVRTEARGRRNTGLYSAWRRLAEFADVLDVAEVRAALTAAALEADGGHTDGARLRKEIEKVLR